MKRGQVAIQTFADGVTGQDRTGLIFDRDDPLIYGIMAALDHAHLKLGVK